MNMNAAYSCRFCGELLQETFIDLGVSPLCESYIAAEAMGEPELFYPLHVFVCGKCFLVQLPEHVSAQAIFQEYAYFSSYSDSWLAHAKTYADEMSQRLSLGSDSLVVEVASNDGYLLQYFQQRGIPVLGIEPAQNVAQVAIEKGIPSVTEFFGCKTARSLVSEGKQPDLLLGNNVLAHVPDINDFVGGLKLLLKQGGWVTMEFPHLMKLMEENQFDTIYHEHFSYLSLSVVERIFAAHGLAICGVRELPTHGGSLRIYARHADEAEGFVCGDVAEMLRREKDWGVHDLECYRRFTKQVEETKRNILQFLIQAREAGKSIAGYGAPGKGNTLLNYCGIRTDLLSYTVDRNPYKHGKFTPGTRIPIFPPERIRETKPDFVFILPWNLEGEIVAQNDYIREWGGQFVVPIPRVKVS